jgi:hypothetical protein
MIHAFLSMHLPSTLLEKRYVFSYRLRKASTADVDHAETPSHLRKGYTVFFCHSGRYLNHALYLQILPLKDANPLQPR